MLNDETEALVYTRNLPYTLTIIATYQCTAACKECCFQSNPKKHGRVPQARLLGYIDEAVELKTIKLVCFSGGEAFLLGKDLIELVQRCTERGFTSRIVSNGYWAVNEKGARSRLEPLIAAGLTEINFSTGDDHATFVPLERVVQGMHVALHYGLTIALMIEERNGQTITLDSILATAQRDSPSVHRALQNGTITVVGSPWMKFSEDDEQITQATSRLANSSNVARREPCKSVLTTVVVTPEENLAMCCGLPREGIPELHAGNLKEHSMRSLVDSGLSDFMNIWLFVEGPERILAWAAKHDPKIEWENRYAHNCDACRALFGDERVRAVLQNHYTSKFDEVLKQYALFTQLPGKAERVSELDPEFVRDSQPRRNVPHTEPLVQIVYG